MRTVDHLLPVWICDQRDNAHPDDNCGPLVHGLAHYVDMNPVRLAGDVHATGFLQSGVH